MRRKLHQHFQQWTGLMQRGSFWHRAGHFCLLAGITLWLETGCFSTSNHPSVGAPPFVRTEGKYPADGMLVQRGLFTIVGRQFAINGYLAMNAAGARRLIVTETFGNVMADVLVKPDGTVFVLKTSRLFPEKYIRKQMVPDLECLFGPETVTNCPATMPEPNHFIIDRGWNKLDFRIVETKPGIQPAHLFDETQGAAK